MAIKYSLIERINPADLSMPRKIYAVNKSSGELSLRQLSKRIADMSTVSSIDTMAVLEALVQVIPEELSDGNIIRLGDFGSFYAKIKSSGAETEDDFNSSYIVNTRIKFRPGSQLKNVINDVKYQKA